MKLIPSQQLAAPPVIARISRLARPKPLDVWINESSEAKRWLIPGWIPEDAFVLLSGQKKRAGKSTLAFMMSLLIAGKINYKSMIPQRQARVLIVEEEGSRSSTKERFEALLAGLGAKPQQIREALQNILFSFRQCVKLDSPASVAEILNWIQEENIGVVVIDPLAHIMTGDENKVNEVRQVIDAIGLMRKLNVVVILIAHTDKGRGEDAKQDIDAQVRGSGVITDSYDFHLALRRYTMNDKTISLTIRSRDDEERHLQIEWLYDKDGDRTIAAHLEIEAENLEISDHREACEQSYDHPDEDEGPPDPRLFSVLLLPGRAYSIQMLMSIWRVDKRKAIDSAGILITKRKMIKTSEGYKLA